MTKEESKKQVIDYLTKTSKHVFELKKTYYSGETDERVYLKVLEVNDEFAKVLDNGKIRNISIDSAVKYYGGNAKNVIGNSLFVMRDAKSVRQTKYVKEEINKQLEAVVV